MALDLSPDFCIGNTKDCFHEEGNIPDDSDDSDLTIVFLLLLKSLMFSNFSEKFFKMAARTA